MSSFFSMAQTSIRTLLDLCVSSLRRGHANLLCIVPILTDDPRRESERSSAEVPLDCKDKLCGVSLSECLRCLFEKMEESSASSCTKMKEGSVGERWGNRLKCA